jgi:hypothetical protein
MTKFFRRATALMLALLFAGPALALSPQSETKLKNLRVTNNTRVGGTLTVTGATTLTGAVTQAGNQTVSGNLAVTGTSLLTGVATLTAAPVLSSGTLTANGDTITIQDLGNANIVQSEGVQTINGVKTFGSAPTITGGLTAANIQTGSAKRQVQTVRLSPETGVNTDATVYRGMLYFGRAGTIKQVMYGTHVDPVSGTNLLKVEKATFGGTTLLSTASVSLNGTTADVGVVATLTATTIDLTLTATQAICLEYNAGTQGTDAEQVTMTVEWEPADF